VKTCPIPIRDYPAVTLAHGGGGLLMQDLIERMFRAAFDDGGLETGNDSTVFAVQAGRLAMTTDSYVVRPLFFPGGDIGSLAINGTVNDLLMGGARPRYLSLGMILEEGLAMETLWRVVQSLAATARAAGVAIITGDTKVVDRGKGDGVYLNTAGVGELVVDPAPGPRQIQAGDVILLSGDVGRHGTAIMAAREGLGFETTLASDCASLTAPVLGVLEQGVAVHALRDLTRGGLATALVELARVSGRTFEVEAAAVPVRDEVAGACELLGLDPLYVANEGRMVMIVPEVDADEALRVMRRCDVSEGACRIGRVTDEARGQVRLTSQIGAARLLDLLSGEQLPRIC
jgi:hydrogenase expression/formation protein HypE